MAQERGRPTKRVSPVSFDSLSALSSSTASSSASSSAASPPAHTTTTAASSSSSSSSSSSNSTTTTTSSSSSRGGSRPRSTRRTNPPPGSVQLVPRLVPQNKTTHLTPSTNTEPQRQRSSLSVASVSSLSSSPLLSSSSATSTASASSTSSASSKSSESSRAGAVPQPQLLHPHTRQAAQVPPAQVERQTRVDVASPATPTSPTAEPYPVHVPELRSGGSSSSSSSTAAAAHSLSSVALLQDPSLESPDSLSATTATATTRSASHPMSRTDDPGLRNRHGKSIAMDSGVGGDGAARSNQAAAAAAASTSGGLGTTTTTHTATTTSTTTTSAASVAPTSKYTYQGVSTPERSDYVAPSGHAAKPDTISAAVTAPVSLAPTFIDDAYGDGVDVDPTLYADPSAVSFETGDVFVDAAEDSGDERFGGGGGSAAKVSRRAEREAARLRGLSLDVAAAVVAAGKYNSEEGLWSRLPAECVARIASSLDVEALCSLAGSCRAWREVVLALDPVWRAHTAARFGLSTAATEALESFRKKAVPPPPWRVILLDLCSSVPINGRPRVTPAISSIPIPDSRPFSRNAIECDVGASLLVLRPASFPDQEVLALNLDTGQLGMVHYLSLPPSYTPPREATEEDVAIVTAARKRAIRMRSVGHYRSVVPETPVCSPSLTLVCSVFLALAALAGAAQVDGTFSAPWVYLSLPVYVVFACGVYIAIRNVNDYQYSRLYDKEIAFVCTGSISLLLFLLPILVASKADGALNWTWMTVFLPVWISACAVLGGPLAILYVHQDEEFEQRSLLQILYYYFVVPILVVALPVLAAYFVAAQADGMLDMSYYESVTPLAVLVFLVGAFVAAKAVRCPEYKWVTVVRYMIEAWRFPLTNCPVRMKVAIFRSVSAFAATVFSIVTIYAVAQFYESVLPGGTFYVVLIPAGLALISVAVWAIVELMCEVWI